MKRKLHITAIHPNTLQTVDLFYYSIKQAKYYNPVLIEFQIEGYEKK